MHEGIEYLKTLNWSSLLTIIIATWYFSRGLKKEVKAIHHDLKFMNIRLSRLEGTVYGAKIYAGLLPVDAKEEEKS